MCLYVCVYLCTHLYVCAFARMCAHVRISVCVCVRTRTLYRNNSLQSDYLFVDAFLVKPQSVVDKILKANVILMLTDPITRRDYLIEEICLKMRI